MTNEEITLGVDRDILEGWLKDPITGKVFEFLEKIQASYKDSAAYMPTESYSIEQIAKELCRVRGVVEGIDTILQIKSSQEA